MARFRNARLAAVAFGALFLSVPADWNQPGFNAAPPPAAWISSAPAAPLADASVRPTLFLERSSTGATYLRVQENLIGPFSAAAPQRSLRDRLLGPSPGANHRLQGLQNTLVANVDIVGMKHGLQLMNTATVSIYDYTYTQFAGGGQIHGSAIKIGDNGQPTLGPTYIQRVVADGRQAPDGSYRVSNTDFIGIERGSGPVFIRNVTGVNFGDAGIDTKSPRVYVMNATLSNAHRMLRLWSGAEIVLVNSIVNAAPGHSQIWLRDASARLSYYNVLWCRGASAPSPSDPACGAAPTAIEGDTISAAAAAQRVARLGSNPLPRVSAVFSTQIDRIVVQYSTNNGATWRTLSLPNTGENGIAPVGDLRYRLPLNLNNGDYLFRAAFQRNGVKVGATSQVIDEAGRVRA